MECPVSIHSIVYLIQRQFYIGRWSNSYLSVLPEELCPLTLDFVSTHFLVSLAYFPVSLELGAWSCVCLLIFGFIWTSNYTNLGHVFKKPQVYLTMDSKSKQS